MQVKIDELVNTMHIVELSAVTRLNAIRELVNAVNWADENVLPDDVVKAIEEREATADDRRPWSGFASRNDQVGR